jgi:hypothetical protein
LRTRITIVLTLVLLFQLFCLSYWISFSSFTEDTPILIDDYPFHYSQIVSVVNFLHTDGHRWGYNPFLLAGYPAPVFLGEDQMAWELFVYVLSPFLPLGVSFKLYVGLFLLLFPFLCYFSGRNFGLGEQECYIAMILGILIFYIPVVYEYIYPLMGGAAMFFFGMASYIFLCYLSMYVLSLLYKFLEHGGKKEIILLFIFFPLLWLTHALAPVLLVVPTMIILFFYVRNGRKRNYLSLTLLSIWTIFINSYWILPLFKFLEYKKTIAAILPNWAQKNLYLPYEFYIKSISSGDIFYALILVTGLIGLYLSYRDKKHTFALALSGQFIFMFFLYFYGGFFVLTESIHPIRYSFPLHLFLIFPCAVTIKRLLGKPIRGIVFVVIFIFSVSAPINTFFIKPLFFKNYYLLKAASPGMVENLCAWIRENTTSKARILFENTKSQFDHFPFLKFDSHLTGLLPIKTKREFIAGPIAMPKENPWIAHNFSTFGGGDLFWRSLNSYSIEELRSYFDLYNINWIVCWSKSATNYFKGYPGYLKFTRKIGGFYIYNVLRRPSFFFKGEGDIVSDYNRLMLKNIKPRDNEIVIKYHWMKYLKTEPELKMERVMLLDDPVGFIKITDPPSSLVIYNAY